MMDCASTRQTSKMLLDTPREARLMESISKLQKSFELTTQAMSVDLRNIKAQQDDLLQRAQAQAQPQQVPESKQQAFGASSPSLAELDRLLANRLGQDLVAFSALFSKELTDKLAETANRDKLELSKKIEKLEEQLSSYVAIPTPRRALAAQTPKEPAVSRLEESKLHVEQPAVKRKLGVGLGYGKDPSPQAPEIPEPEAPLLQEAPFLQADSVSRSLSASLSDGGDKPKRRTSRRGVNKNDRQDRGAKELSRKLSLHEDHDVDTSAVRLKDSSSIGNVFAYDTDLESPPYHVEEHYWEHGIFQEIAKSHQFATLTMCVVIFNAAWLAVDTYNESDSLYASAWIYIVATQFFGIYFTIELIIRFMAFKDKVNCLHDGWFRFDLFLLVTMILDIWVLQVVTHISAEGSEGGARIPTQPLRILRLFKLSRMARLMKAFPELVTMIKGIAQATRAVASSMLLITVMLYSWAIFIQSLVGNDDELNKYLDAQFDYHFSNITESIWALLMVGTLMLDNTALLLTYLMFSQEALHVIVGIAVLTFLFFSSLLVLQMLIGILTDVVSQVQTARQEAETVGLIKQELLRELCQVQSKGGKITKPNLMRVLSAERSKAIFKKLEINRLFLMNMAALCFPSDDCEISAKTILELMVMCRSNNNATVQIVSHALAFISGEIGDLHAYCVHHLHELTGYLEGDEIYGRLPGETHTSIRQAMLNDDFE